MRAHDDCEAGLEFGRVGDEAVDRNGDFLPGEYRLTVAQHAQNLLGVGLDELGV